MMGPCVVCKFALVHAVCTKYVTLSPVDDDDDDYDDENHPTSINSCSIVDL